MIDYDNSIYSMLSYAGIRNQVLSTQEKSINHINNIKTKRQNRRFLNIPNYSEDPSIICAINSNPLLLDILASYRKQKAPIGYIYITSTDIKFFIKVIPYYPILIYNLPITNYDIYVNSSIINECYSFPLSYLSIKQSLNLKQYQLILYKKENLYIDFITYINNDISNSVKIINVNHVPDEIAYRILNFNNLQENPIKILNSSIIYILSEITDNINISSKKFNFKNVYISINSNKDMHDEKMVKISENNNIVNSIILSSKEQSIYWNLIHKENIKFNIENNDLLFKINYSRFLNNKYNLYLVLAGYDDYYILMLVSYKGEITDINCNRSLLFNNVFDKNPYLIELYLLKPV